MSMPGYTQYGGRPTQAGPAQPSVAPYPGLQPGVPAYPGMQQVPPQPAVSAEKRGGKMASWISLVCGIIGLVIVGATVFVMWEMMNDPATRSDPGGVWVFRTVCFERVVLSSPGCLWPGRMDDHEEVLEAHA